MDHLRKEVSYLKESGQVVRSFEESSVPLGVARFGYDGGAWSWKTFKLTWWSLLGPEVGQAAVQDAVNFVPLALKEKLEDPRSCLLLLHEWPDPPPQSKVRASDEEWHKVVKAAYARGLMAPVEVSDVFVDSGGRPVLNGAGSVVKYKRVDDEMVRVQCFISNFIPTNSFQARLEDDDHMLPYLGQVTLLQQGPEEV